MPTYEYVCKTKHCEGAEEFTIVHGIKEDAKSICPFCSKKTLERLISSNTSFSLKGNGWASEGYSSNR